MAITYYEIRARRPSDFALIEEEQQDGRVAYKAARHHYANGYDVTVTMVAREQVAEWKQEDRKDD